MTCEVSFRMDLKDWDVTKFMKLMDLGLTKNGSFCQDVQVQYVVLK